MSTAPQLLPVADPWAGRLSRAASLAAAVPLVAAPHGAKPGPRLVYVVENDRISSVVTELIVKKNLFGGGVQCYANGQQAFADISLALQHSATIPDLVILDLDMPLMDGWEFLDALANLALPHPIQVFVLTSSIHSDDRARALSYEQVAGFFTKPLKEAGVALMQRLLQAD